MTIEVNKKAAAQEGPEKHADSEQCAQAVSRDPTHEMAQVPPLYFSAVQGLLLIPRFEPWILRQGAFRPHQQHAEAVFNLLSLWEVIGYPIRCLDEFDVFMDAGNR